MMQQKAHLQLYDQMVLDSLFFTADTTNNKLLCQRNQINLKNCGSDNLFLYKLIVAGV
jgi:hypothetical protein